MTAHPPAPTEISSLKAPTTRAGHASRAAGALLLALCLGLIAASSASAAYEQVGHFSGTGEPQNPAPEEVQLSGVGGMAVNRTGVGGVPAGTLYVARQNLVGDSRLEVARYNPDGSFSERWTFEGTLHGSPEERCGPDGEPSHPACTSNPGVGTEPKAVDVEVNQSTGDVYVFNGRFNGFAGRKAIHVFSSDGAELIAEFDEVAKPGETTAESPEKLHSRGSLSVVGGSLAVNGAGDAYVFDQNTNEGYVRLAEFVPQSPGDYEHYVYAGQEHDLAVSVGEPEEEFPEQPVFDDAGDLYIASESKVRKLDPSNPAAAPLCEFEYASSGITAFTVNGETGEAFFATYKDRNNVHRLNPCEGGTFSEGAPIPFTPKSAPEALGALTVDPGRSWGPGRPAGVLYLGDAGQALGYIFARAAELPPEIEALPASHVTTTTAQLSGELNPKGWPTRYAFQYETAAEYEASEPDERQSLTVSAAAGVYGLSFEGRSLGGEATADLTAGSKSATSLRTATATATLKGAIGTGTLSGARGQGTTVKGSSTITSVDVSEGSFAVGQEIHGQGIPAGARITKVSAEAGLPTEAIGISEAATESKAGVTLSNATKKVTALATSEGSFEAGQSIGGKEIPFGTTIVAVGAGELTLSKAATGPAAGIALIAGTDTLSSVSLSSGGFEAGQAIEGEGIPSKARVLAVEGSALKISAITTKPGSGVAVYSPGPEPLAAGEQVEGPGIPAGTRIRSIEAGRLTLSKAATASGTAVALHAGIAVDAPPTRLRAALEGLPTIGAGDVEVSGGPGDESGTSPYEITFHGKFENVDVPQLEVSAPHLSGGPATAEAQTEHNGGGGFAGGALEAPLGGAPAGEGKDAVVASASLVGLIPGTAYRYRLVAASHCHPEEPEALCESAGEAQFLRTFAAIAPGLPDRRAYELVSPPDKQGGEVVPADPRSASCRSCKPGSGYALFPRQSALSGDEVAYEAGSFDSEASALRENQYVARRDPATGWQSASITPTQLLPNSPGYRAFAAELGAGVLKQQKGEAVPFGSGAPAGYEELYSQPTANPLALTPLIGEGQAFHRSATQFQIEYAGSSADLSRIFFSANDALTEETPFAPAAVDGGASKQNIYEWHEGRLSLVNVMPGNAEAQPGASLDAVSEDGTKAFFSAESGQVFERLDGESTRAIETEGIPDTAGFLTAAGDGSAVLLAGGHLHFLTGEEATVDLSQGKGGFEALAGQSEDLSHVYFLDEEVLDEAPNERGEEAEEGARNLYAWVQGQGTRFVARLGAGASLKGAQASPHGRYLAFLSKASLTGYDNLGPTCSVTNDNTTRIPGLCSEAFLYDSTSAHLSCPSCNPTGEPPLGQGTSLRQGSHAPWARYLTDEGRLLFDSGDSLVPADTNEGVEDVYEWEPRGVGGCESESNEGGCLRLISAGTGTLDSNFLAMDASGKNVFFTTADELALKDRDQLVDLYDAREGGGIGAETEVARAECQGEACQPPVAVPEHPTPATSAPAGEGNAVAPHKQKKRKKAKKHRRGHKHRKRHGRKAKKRHGKRHANRAAKRHQGGHK